MQFSFVVFLFFALMLTGCHARSPSAPQNEYQTITADPHRDTEAARELDNAALKLMDKSDYAGAAPLLRQALLKDVTFGPAHNNLGLVYFHQSQLYLAAWEFQYTIKLMPNQPEARNNLGLVFEAGGKFDQAVDAFDQAMKLQPENPQFIGNDARARIRRGDTGPEVRELLAKIVQVDSRDDWIAWAKDRLIFMKSESRSPDKRQSP
ncbi:MAG TPA: tetratricopeptide repeat protein [Tepidisphaeraceae bacterium]|jgi:Tfp pilus assembly protein PilF|nr:tetratricopeptide repeat protein [Tepidisphaeraceae bacterium]